MARFDRLLNIIAALQDTSLPLTAEDLRRRVPGYEGLSDDSFHRAFERDKDELRDIGIPIETVNVEHQDQQRAGYTIDRQAYELADPGLTPEELAALYLAATAVRLDGADDSEITGAFFKLGGVGAQGEGPSIGSVEVPELLPEIFTAVTDRRRITFIHGGRERHLDPFRLEFARARWYVTGHDPDRGEGRSFRVDRMSAIEHGAAGTFERPDAVPGVRLLPWEYGEGEPRTALIRFDPEIVATVLAENPGLEVVSREPDGSAIISLTVRNSHGLRDFVLSYLDRAELLSPPELRRELVAWVAATAEAS